MYSFHKVFGLEYSIYKIEGRKYSLTSGASYMTYIMSGCNEHFFKYFINLIHAWNFDPFYAKLPYRHPQYTIQ